MTSKIDALTVAMILFGTGTAVTGTLQLLLA